MWFDNTQTKASLLRDYGEPHAHMLLSPILLSHCFCVFLSNNNFVPANKYWSGLLRDYYGPRAAL
jgi:alpha-N-acetylglucosaminidase